MIDEMSHYDTTGKLTSNHSIARQAMKDFSEKYNKMPFLLGWHECRQLLFDELPPGIVQFDKQVFNSLYLCTCDTQHTLNVTYCTVQYTHVCFCCPEHYHSSIHPLMCCMTLQISLMKHKQERHQYQRGPACCIMTQ